MRTVKCKSGLTGYQCRLRANYKGYKEFESYAETYGLHTRLGYKTPRAAWDANPTVQGSVDPSDFRKVKTPPGDTIGWKRATNGAKVNHWFVMHHERKLYYSTSAGNLIWFASSEAAQRKADELNRKHPNPKRQDTSYWSPRKVKQ